MSSSLKETYERDGFVIVPDLIPADQRPALEAACARVVARTRAGDWSHRRTVGKQFPPFDNDNPDSWGVQHVMHPDLGEPIFAQWYAGDTVLRVVMELLGCAETDLQMGVSFHGLPHIADR